MIDEIERDVLRALQRYQPTVWDARSLLRSRFGQVHSFVIDDGQHGDVERHGVLLDILHAPDSGFSLLLKGLLPHKEKCMRDAYSREELRRTVALPLGVFRRLPECLEFLSGPAHDWPLPPPHSRCLACGSSTQTGRFCTQCGNKIQGKGHHLGPGFAVEQQALRTLLAEDDAAVMEHRCGAVVLWHWNYCSKCSIPTGSIGGSDA